MSFAYTAAQIRAAEQPLLDAQEFPDQLMQQAAHGVAQAAQTMLAWPEHPLTEAIKQVKGTNRDRVLLLVGSGGNGGDALYAGAELALAGVPVDALLVTGSAHERALTAFTQAGGSLIDDPQAANYRLAIDGITGIGGSGPLRDSAAEMVQALKDWYVDMLAVDVPSGVDADTGIAHDPHVDADVTVTFGGWRLTHGLAPECGVQLLADIGLGGKTLAEVLREKNPDPSLILSRASHQQEHGWPEQLTTLDHVGMSPAEPGPHDDKYTGGVVGIRAGSGMYPGAALLATAGAVNATPAMVRYAGPQALEVVHAHPEVVVTKAIAQAGRVQAWVFGPGAGTGDEALQELTSLLERDEPLLIDADGLTIVAENQGVRELVDKRKNVVLTPHDGEFARLREACGLESTDRLAETQQLAEHLGCTIVRKGRATIIAGAGYYVDIIDAGNSWAATPGSGDVLAGIIGAFMARGGAQFPDIAVHSIREAVTVHARAALLSARTEHGPAPTSASRIAAAVPQAIAALARRRF